MAEKFLHKAHNFYDVLGVKPSSTQQQIKEAFLIKSKKLHPDKNIGNPNAHADFLKIQEAYGTLSKPGNRSAYDRRINPSAYKAKSQSAKYRTKGPKHAYDPNAQVYTDENYSRGIGRMQEAYGKPFVDSPRFNADYMACLQDPKLFDEPAKLIRKFNTPIAKAAFGITVLVGVIMFTNIVAWGKNQSKLNSVEKTEEKIEAKEKAEKYRENLTIFQETFSKIDTTKNRKL